LYLFIVKLRQFIFSYFTKVCYFSSDCFEYSMFISSLFLILEGWSFPIFRMFGFFPNSLWFIYSSGEIHSFTCCHDCVYLSSSFGCRIFLSDFCNACLVVMNSFSLCLPWKVFTSLLILKNNLAGYSNLDWHLLSLRTWNPTFHALLAVTISVEKSVTMMDLPLNLTWCFFLVTFN
jgi:hypothetical protein